MVKNGLYVRNAPAGLFADTDTLAYLYAEIYGLRQGTDSAGYFQSSVTVSDSAGSFARDMGWKQVAKPGSAAAVTQAIDIRGWPAGLYRVQLSVVDRANSDTAQSSLPLRILGPAMTTTNASQRPGRTCCQAWSSWNASLSLVLAVTVTEGNG